MTNKLAAVNRWCVTGTPVQRDLSGMYTCTLIYVHVCLSCCHYQLCICVSVLLSLSIIS